MNRQLVQHSGRGSGQAGGVFRRQGFWVFPKKTLVGRSDHKRPFAGRSASSGSAP